MIEHEASANDYYYNYPPKQEDDGKKADKEQMKLKRIFDEQMAAANRTFERKYEDMATSFTE